MASMDQLAAGRRRAPGAAACVADGQALAVHSFDEWRRAARLLLARRVAPELVHWTGPQDDGELFARAQLAPAGPGGAVQAPPLRIGRKLMGMLEGAACCRAPQRWALLYRVLWRWQQGDHAVLSAADRDGARLHAMVRAVRRAERDMHARIRFRERRADAGPPRFVAWFEPAHDVLPRVARHFAGRMGRVSWMIATPDASVMWDGAALHSTGALMGGPGEIEAGDAPWLTYCRSIYLPDRLHTELLDGGRAEGL